MTVTCSRYQNALRVSEDFLVAASEGRSCAGSILTRTEDSTHALILRMNLPLVKEHFQCKQISRLKHDFGTALSH